MTAVAGVAPSFGVAVDGSGQAVIHDGAGWSTPTSIDSPNHLSGISCVPGPFCVAVDSGGYAVNAD